MSQTQKWIIVASIVGLFFLIYILGPMLTPFFVAGLLAYLGDPLVNRLIQYKIPRTLAATIVFLILLLGVALLLFLIVPLIEKQVELAISRLPDLLIWLQLTLIPWLNEHFNLSINFDIDTLKKAVSGHWQQAGDVAQYAIKTLHESWLVILEIAINIILIPVVTFYLLRDWDIVVAKTKELIPPKILPPLSKILGECNEVIGAFFRGQLLVMLILSAFYSIGLWAVGLNFALLIGVVIGVLSIIPYLGSVLGLLISGIATYAQFHDIKHLLYTLFVFLVGHVLENMILAPLLIGERIGLHPVAVIFAVLAGGKLFGFVGVILALPAGAVIMVLIRYLHNLYINSEFYKKSKISDVINTKS
jgi:predicted PurR-regulated permease PerM